VGERTEYAPGTFCAVDLGTTDVAAARDFYSGLFGWEGEEAEMPGGGGTYTMLRLDGRAVAGMYRQVEGAPPAWLSYVSVEDADAAAGRAQELGATVLSAPSDVPGAGRMAVLQDPQGAVFALWQAAGYPGAQLVNDPGALGLNQLNAVDVDVARRFYSELFGWRFEQVSDSPPYEGIDNGERLNGGMMAMPAEAGGAPSHWLAYFTSADLDAAAARIAELGGSGMVPPTPVPGGRFLVAGDPQGAVFGLFEGRVDP
jgi:predicted enzyme related to lactoylglutathione lyase